MIPLLQNDYYKYSQMFRGNFLKGATLFRSFLNDPVAKEHILSSVPALSAVFTDCTKTEANRLCYDILIEKGCFQEALMTYLQGIEATAHNDVSALFQDTGNVLSLLRNEELEPILAHNPSLFRQMLQVKSTYHAISESANHDVTLMDDVLDTYSSIAQPTGVNLYTAFSTYWSSIYYQTTAFESSEVYYSYTAYYEWMVVNEKADKVFLPVSLQTRVSSASTYYYYPAVFCYDIALQQWELLYVASTDKKQTNYNYYSRQAYLCYDQTKDQLYVFYRPLNTSAQVLCDIVTGSTGTAVMTEIELASVGSYSYMEPYWCAFDEEQGLARFVWVTGTISDSSSSTPGWLYGASVRSNGLVWAGVVCHPRAQYSPCYSSYMQVMSYRPYLRSPAGAVVGAFQESSKTASSAAVLMVLTPDGEQIKTNYIRLPVGTNYGTVSSPNYYFLSDTGILSLCWNSIQWSGTQYSVCAVFDVKTGTLLQTFVRDTGTPYALYTAPFFRAFLLYANASPTPVYLAFAEKNGSVLPRNKTRNFALFSTQAIQERGAHRYKLYASNSSNWILYDYERSLMT